mmetsp:Transcript_43554/g.125923  ORF Transcript_43554/g.125923 Transcript_43554/m.125923 type:complete len:217 (+) Transcript_43554:674-1324(+)
MAAAELADQPAKEQLLVSGADRAPGGAAHRVQRFHAALPPARGAGAGPEEVEQLRRPGRCRGAREVDAEELGRPPRHLVHAARLNAARRGRGEFYRAAAGARRGGSEADWGHRRRCGRGDRGCSGAIRAELWRRPHQLPPAHARGRDRARARRLALADHVRGLHAGGRPRKHSGRAAEAPHPQRCHRPSLRAPPQRVVGASHTEGIAPEGGLGAPG